MPSKMKIAEITAIAVCLTACNSVSNEFSDNAEPEISQTVSESVTSASDTDEITESFSESTTADPDETTAITSEETTVTSIETSGTSEEINSEINVLTTADSSDEHSYMFNFGLFEDVSMILTDHSKQGIKIHEADEIKDIPLSRSAYNLDEAVDFAESEYLSDPDTKPKCEIYDLYDADGMPIYMNVHLYNYSEDESIISDHMFRMEVTYDIGDEEETYRKNVTCLDVNCMNDGFNLTRASALDFLKTFPNLETLIIHKWDIDSAIASSEYISEYDPDMIPLSKDDVISSIRESIPKNCEIIVK